MLTLPVIIDRAAEVYAFVPFTVRMDQMKTPADEGFPKLFGYLEQSGINPTGAAFFNYRRIDMANTLDVEAGVTVERAGIDGEGVVFATTPAGRFVTLDWHGPYDELEQVTAMLIGWVRLMGLAFDMREAPEGDYFACRLEIYETDPSETPDPQDWVTRLAFKLAD